MTGHPDMARARGRDEGFSLTELLVVLGIMGVVITGAYSLSTVTKRAADVSEIESAFAHEIGTALQLSEIYLQQNIELDEWGDYRLVCFVDRDLDGFSERVTIEAESDGTLSLSVWDTDVQHVNTTERIDFLMSEHSVNVANGNPLFTYLAADASVITTLDARASDTRSVIVNVEIEVDGDTMNDERTIFFRNR